MTASLETLVIAAYVFADHSLIPRPAAGGAAGAGTPVRPRKRRTPEKVGGSYETLLVELDGLEQRTRATSRAGEPLPASEPLLLLTFASRSGS